MTILVSKSLDIPFLYIYLPNPPSIQHLPYCAYHIPTLPQEDLVQIAFAGPDLEADFAKMKGTDIDEELGIEQKRNKILNDGTDVYSSISA